MARRKRQRCSFSDQVRAAVEGSDKTRYRIAKETGIDAAVLCRFVHGERGISLANLDILAECLGLRVVADDE